MVPWKLWSPQNEPLPASTYILFETYFADCDAHLLYWPNKTWVWWEGFPLASLMNATEVNNCLISIEMWSLWRSPSPSNLISARMATSCSMHNFVMRCWWFNKLAKSIWNAVWKISSLLGFTGAHWTFSLEWPKFLSLPFRNP